MSVGAMGRDRGERDAGASASLSLHLAVSVSVWALGRETPETRGLAGALRRGEVALRLGMPAVLLTSRPL